MSNLKQVLAGHLSKSKQVKRCQTVIDFEEAFVFRSVSEFRLDNHTLIREHDAIVVAKVPIPLVVVVHLILLQDMLTKIKVLVFFVKYLILEVREDKDDVVERPPELGL